MKFKHAVSVLEHLHGENIRKQVLFFTFVRDFNHLAAVA